MRRAAAIADGARDPGELAEGVLVTPAGAFDEERLGGARGRARAPRRVPGGGTRHYLLSRLAQEVLDAADVAVAPRAHLRAEVNDLLLLVVAKQRKDLGADLRVEDRAVALGLREVRGTRANGPLVDGVRQDRVVERPAGVLGRLELRLDLGGVRPEDRLDLRFLIVGQVEDLGDAREARRTEAPGGSGCRHGAGEETAREESGRGDDGGGGQNQDRAANLLDAHGVGFPSRTPFKR